MLLEVVDIPDCCLCSAVYSTSEGSMGGGGDDCIDPTASILGGGLGTIVLSLSNSSNIVIRSIVGT
jgi:hypothetical protein